MNRPRPTIAIESDHRRERRGWWEGAAANLSANVYLARAAGLGGERHKFFAFFERHPGQFGCAAVLFQKTCARIWSADKQQLGQDQSQILDNHHHQRIAEQIRREFPEIE
jgi:hypothetical protein